MLVFTGLENLIERLPAILKPYFSAKKVILVGDYLLYLQLHLLLRSPFELVLLIDYPLKLKKVFDNIVLIKVSL